jgi:putative tryptophan/tyrosine transport system substrate-binding protein
MRRRELITLLAGAAGWPLTTRAQAASIPTVGFLGPTAAQAWTAWTKAFVDRFAELGWVDGRTVKMVYRWANGRPSALRNLPKNWSRSKSISS